MAGQDGFEFIGSWPDAAAVRDALMSAGSPLGLVQVGAWAYASASVESGWIPSPIPAIYSDPDLAGYRRWLPLFGIEGQRPLNGSFFSENIEDYYCTPYELGYGRSIAFNHDFIGRAALEKARADVRRTKVTLAGLTYQTATIDPAGTILSLTLIDTQYAEPGTEVSVVWGEHPGPGTPADADLGFPRIRATVQPAPFDDHARHRYRQNR